VLRRVLFHIHCWTGIVVGLYVVVVCATGSLLVFRVEFYEYFRPGTFITQRANRLNEAQLTELARRDYPQARIVRVLIPRRRTSAAEVYIEGDGAALHRLFDPYTGRDCGDADPQAVIWFEKISKLHGNLMAGQTGRLFNGIGSIAVLLLSATGMALWWRGMKHWTRGLFVRWGKSWKAFNWDLHSAVGFWTSVVVFLWALTGVYFSFPRFFAPLGDPMISFFVSMHFGRTYGLPVKFIWAFVGMMPPLLFVTGAIMWWNRWIKAEADPQTRRFLGSRVPRSKVPRSRLRRRRTGNLGTRKLGTRSL
jgi:uncharacterized iron-regulated membrane protein